MPHSEAQAWWADVQHVRESIERRRAGGVDASAPLDDADERRFSRAAADSLPLMDDLDWSSSLSARSGGRFEHSGSGERRTGRGRRDDDPAAEEPLDFDAERAALESPRRRRDGDRDERADRRASARGSRRSGAPEHEASARRTPAHDGSDRAGSSSTAAEIVATALAPPTRRTVQITGRTVAAPSLPRLVEVERRRPARRPAERVGPRPDRIALWAVLLGFFLILVAATSSHAATQPAHAGATAAALHAPAR